jgi:hypothetical protein
MVPRRRRGANSAAIAIKQGVAPPRPRPAKKRYTIKVWKESARAVANVKIPNRTVAAIRTRNNLLTFISAGHETTALALTWTFYLLGLHPDVEQRVRSEITAVTGGGPVRPQHIEVLSYTNQVFQEAMRLYPPASLKLDN